MATPRKAPVVQHPRFVRHAARPAWGIGRVVDVYAGLFRVRFGDGVTREFRDNVLEAVAESDVSPEMLAATEAPPAAPARASVAPKRKRA